MQCHCISDMTISAECEATIHKVPQPQILKASVTEFILAILSSRNVKIGPTVETSNKAG